MLRPGPLALALVLLAALTIGGVTLGRATGLLSPPTSRLIRDAPAGSALAALGHLRVAGRAPRTGYSREAFGQAWSDVDHNGCDTRDDVLRRDLRRVRTGAGEPCTVTSGQLDDPYRGVVMDFERGPDSAAVQIDHVVALSNAWQTGAQALTPSRRLALANDPLELLAVDGEANQAKGDADAATWLPPDKEYQCTYVARQVDVKRAYHLWVTPAERDAIAGVLARCPHERLPSDDAPRLQHGEHRGTAP